MKILTNEDYVNLVNRPETDIIKYTDDLYKLKNKTILVTGGLGSIGNEIVRQLLNLNLCKQIIIYDNNECNYFYFKNEINDNCLLQNTRNNINVKMILGDIRDYHYLEYIFKNNKIDYVYHAAAYKHVPILEENNYEAVKTNILGTKNVADLSIKNGVSNFTFVSTDKSVNPTNVMGCTKRIAELYINYLSKNNNNTKLNITRFGNVIGSSGSVIPTFLKNINLNKNLLVTNKDITRFFMTITEASKLVILSSCISKGGDTMLFDMGEPIKILDMAKKLLKLLDIHHLDITITGLRPGEKMYEELYGKNEKLIKSNYEKIILLRNEKINYDEFIIKFNDLVNIINSNNYSLDMKRILKNIIPEYREAS